MAGKIVPKTGVRVCPEGGLWATLEILSVFLVTLYTYYFPSIRLAPFPLVAIGVLAFLCLRRGILVVPHSALVMPAVVVLPCILNVAWAMVLLHPYFYWRSIVGAVIVGPMYFILFVTYFRSRPVALQRALLVSVAIQSAAALVQISAAGVWGIHLDYMTWLTGEDQRVTGTGLLTGQIRTAGLTHEPATYCLLIMLLVFLTVRFRTKLNWMHVIALVTVAGSFSLFGLAAGGVFLCFYLGTRYRAGVVKALLYVGSGMGILSLTVMQLYPELFAAYMSARIATIVTDSSFMNRYSIGLSNFLDSAPCVKLFGWGLGNFNDFELSGSTYQYLLNYLGVCFGLLILLGMVGVLWRLGRVSMVSLLYWLFLLLGTIQITGVITWMAMGALQILCHRDAEVSGPRRGRERFRLRRLVVGSIDGIPVGRRLAISRL